jgi:amino acid adenylation domain-containing protein
MQLGMLLHSLNEDGVYVQQLVCSLFESINVPIFVDAWNRVIQRHSVLRSTFRWEDVDTPLQEVHSDIQCPFTIEDWCSLSSESQQKELNSYLKADRELGFEPTDAPLMRVVLFRMGDDDYRAVWTFHHALLDGRSHFLVLKEVFEIYDAFCSGREPKLKQSRPFSDYIKWLTEQEWSRAEQFWRQSLDAFTAPTLLGGPYGYGPSEVRRQRSTHQCGQIRIDEELTSKLRMLARQSEVKLNNLIQASFALLISRHSGEEDVVFGTTRACRHWTVEDTESMVGLFINTVPLRVCARPDQSLISWLKELRSKHIGLREYEHTPLTKIQEWSNIPRGSSLFETALVFEEFETEGIFSALGNQRNLKSRSFKLLEQTNYPLVLAAYAASDITLKLEYDELRFNRSTIERMLNHIKTLLESMASDPGRCIGELSMLTETELQQFAKWNDRFASFPKDRCIHQLFEEQAARTPDGVALILGSRRLTYLELNQQANQLANFLRTLGVGPETPVGLCVERSFEMVIGLLGVLKVGAAYVPLDPTYPSKRLAFMLEDSQARVLLTQHKLASQFNQDTVRTVCLDSDWKVIAKEQNGNPVAEATPENLAYIIYTSGSTGGPKGVLISHSALVSHSLSVVKEYELVPTDRVLQFASISFDVAAEELFPTLLSGAAVVLTIGPVPPAVSDFDALLEKEQITVINLPSCYWHELVLELERSPRPLPSTLRLVVTGSEKVLPERLIAWRKMFGDRIRWLNAYGPSEATVTATIYEPNGANEPNALGAVPIGRPMCNRQIYIVDSYLNQVPVGVGGELCIGGAGLARGYLNSAEVTSKKFIPNPFTTGVEAKLYKTGDRARYLPDGNIELLGRIDRQVKVRGFRIDLGEIENALRQLPPVRDCVVVAREDESGHSRLVAYITPSLGERKLSRSLDDGHYDQFGQNKKQTGSGCINGPGSDTKSSSSETADSLQGISREKLASKFRRLLQEELPEYMVPSSFVMLDELPLTTNGKLDRRALPAPQGKRSHEHVFVAPRNMLESLITKSWEKLLSIKPIGIRDNFFDLGGNSLLGVRLFAQVEKMCGKKLPLATLFQAPTVEQLVSLLSDENWSTSLSSLVAIQPGGSKVPLFCLHLVAGHVLFYRDLAHHLGSDQPVYAFQPQHSDGSQPHHTTIEQMASHYIREMCALQPEGPYYLAGSSSGGLIAFEMAQQLHSQGQEVGLLALFDTYAPGSSEPSPDAGSLRYQIYRILQRINLQIGSLLLLDAKGKVKYVREKSILAWRRLKGSIKRIDNGFKVLAEQHERDVLKAFEEYVPQPYPGRVTLFRASRQPAGYNNAYDLGWGELAGGGLEINEVPGEHGSIVVEPRVGTLAQKLKRCIEKSQEPGTIYQEVQPTILEQSVIDLHFCLLMTLALIQ